MKRSVCLVAGGMETTRLRLQPWRTLLGVADGLACHGHRVVLISDAPRGPLPGHLSRAHLPLVHVPSVRTFGWRVNRPLAAAVACSGADVAIWHLGLSSTLHQRWPSPAGRPVVGFWTAPLYTRRELLGLGLRSLSGCGPALIHLLGAALPRPAVRAGLRAAGVAALVVQTAGTARRLRTMDLWRGPLATVPPGSGHAGGWPTAGDGSATRRQLGSGAQAVVVVDFGPPAPLRGLDPLVQAVALARRRLPSLRLLILSRRRAGEHAGRMRCLRRLIARHHLADCVQIVDGFLPEDELARRVACADVVALPFQLVPSDAPLSVLEARALNRPVVTTRLGCLPELAGADDGLLARPGDPHSLCDALLVAAARRPAGLPPPLRTWEQVGAEWSALVEGL